MLREVSMERRSWRQTTRCEGVNTHIARANFFAQDRRDSAFATKEIALMIAFPVMMIGIDWSDLEGTCHRTHAS